MVADGEEKGRVPHLRVDVEEARIDGPIVEPKINDIADVEHEIGIYTLQNAGDLARRSAGIAGVAQD